MTLSFYFVFLVQKALSSSLNIPFSEPPLWFHEGNIILQISKDRDDQLSFLGFFGKFSSASSVVSVSFGLLFSLCFGFILPLGGFYQCLVIFSVRYFSMLALCHHVHTLALFAIQIIPNSWPLSWAPDHLSKCLFSFIHSLTRVHPFTQFIHHTYWLPLKYSLLMRQSCD